MEAISIRLKEEAEASALEARQAKEAAGTTNLEVLRLEEELSLSILEALHSKEEAKASGREALRLKEESEAHALEALRLKNESEAQALETLRLKEEAEAAAREALLLREEVGRLQAEKETSLKAQMDYQEESKRLRDALEHLKGLLELRPPPEEIIKNYLASPAFEKVRKVMFRDLIFDIFSDLEGDSVAAGISLQALPIMGIYYAEKERRAKKELKLKAAGGAVEPAVGSPSQQAPPQ